MTVLQLVGVSVIASAFSYVGTIGLRRWAERRHMFDVPNQRSSHTKPIARGGGLVIVCLSLLGLFAVWLRNPVWSWQKFAGFAVGSGLISGVSWVDDLKTLSNRIRFVFHALGAILAIQCFGYWNMASIPLLAGLWLDYLGVAVTFLWIVGLTNAYNFMDGIDGIASGQAVVAGLGWVIIGRMLNMPLVSVFGALLASTSLGFLFHNWPPARIFMGDVGSAFLGYSFACLAVIGAKNDPVIGLGGVLILWPFVFDTVFTFCRRLKNREDVFSAHRSHLYQRLVISGLCHRTVTLLYTGLDVLGVLLAVVIVMKKPWADLIVLTGLAVGCCGLWGGTVMRERRISRERDFAKTN